MSIDNFIKAFVNNVFFKLVKIIPESRLDLWLTENFMFACMGEWDGTFPDRTTYINDKGQKVKSEPEFMIFMRKTIREFIGNQKDKVSLKNILQQ